MQIKDILVVSVISIGVSNIRSTYAYKSNHGRDNSLRETSIHLICESVRLSWAYNKPITNILEEVTSDLWNHINVTILPERTLAEAVQTTHQPFVHKLSIEVGLLV